MSATNTISIYNSRKTLLDIFGEKRDLFENVGDYENFNINEVNRITISPSHSQLSTTTHPSLFLSFSACLSVSLYFSLSDLSN